VRIDQRHEAGNRRRRGARAVHRTDGAAILNVKVVRQRGNVREAAALRPAKSTETRKKQRKKSEKNNSTRIVIRKRLLVSAQSVRVPHHTHGTCYELPSSEWFRAADDEPYLCIEHWFREAAGRGNHGRIAEIGSDDLGLPRGRRRVERKPTAGVKNRRVGGWGERGRARVE
jgi:hypothetical protein